MLIKITSFAIVLTLYTMASFGSYRFAFVVLTTLLSSNLLSLIESRVGTSSFDVIYEDENMANNDGVRTVLYDDADTIDSEFSHVPEDQINNFDTLRRTEEDVLEDIENLNFDEIDGNNLNRNNNNARAASGNVGFAVVGGNMVSLNEYKKSYQSVCSILKAKQTKGQTYVLHVCGCTLIAPNVVLTAAHCGGVADYVQIGKLYQLPIRNKAIGLDVETFKVTNTRYHEDWRRATFNNDIMLLKLSGNSKKPVMKLQMSKMSRKNTDIFTVVGWGATSFNSKSSSLLQEVDVNYMHTQTCKDEYYGGSITNSMFCAYTEGKDACQGDSGGPILRMGNNGEYIQIGIVSWGYLCAKYPGVYCDLSGTSAMSDFIHTEICDKRHGLSPSTCSNKRLPHVL